MVSAIRTVCRVLGHTPHELPADLALLNRLLRKALPAAAKVKPRRWANVRSLLLRALTLTGTSIMPGRRLHPLTPAWAALDGAAAGAVPARRAVAVHALVLGRGHRPPEVTVAVSDRFRAAVLNDSLIQNGWSTCQATVRLWNQAVATIPGWPQVVIPFTPARERYVLPLTSFPAAFQADAERWLDRLAGDGDLDEGPLRPARPATLRKWRFAIRQLASALMAAGREPARITSLADLVTPEAAQLILRFYLERAGGKPAAQTQALAAHLKAIARHHVAVSPEVMAKLQRMARKVTPPARHDRQEPRGLAPVRRPSPAAAAGGAAGTALCRPARRRSPPRRWALRLQSALAVAVLSARRCGWPISPRWRSAGPAAHRHRPAGGLDRQPPRRRGQERRAVRGALAGARRPAARPLPPAGCCRCWRRLAPSGCSRARETATRRRSRWVTRSAAFSPASSACG